MSNYIMSSRERNLILEKQKNVKANEQTKQILNMIPEGFLVVKTGENFIVKYFNSFFKSLVIESSNNSGGL